MKSCTDCVSHYTNEEVETYIQSVPKELLHVALMLDADLRACLAVHKYDEAIAYEQCSMEM